MCACMTISSVSMPVYGADSDYIEQTEVDENEQTVSETENTEEKETEPTESGEQDTDNVSEDLEKSKEKETEQEQSGEASDNSGEMSAEEENKEIQTFSSDVVNSGTCGENAKWTYYADKTLVISGSGPMKSYTYDWREYISTAPWMAYRSRIKKIVVEDGITSIGDYAFKECGYGLPGQCTALEEIVIGNDVEEIGKEAFYACNPITVEKIQVVSMGSGIKRIGEDAFRTTGRIKRVEIPNLESWMQIDFEGEASTPMWGGAFPRNNDEVEFYVGGVRIKNLVIPQGVTAIKDYTFWNCRLNSVTWPEQTSIRKLGKGAFAYNDFNRITIPDGINEIGIHSFGCCINLSELKVPDSVHTMGGSAFAGCSSLKSVSLSQSLTEISKGAFYGCSALQSVVLPEVITNIGESAFNRCESLTNIEIPQGVTSIGTIAFAECSSIQNVKIPDSVRTIGVGAFRNCSSITTMVIPNSVQSIGSSAFYNEEKLESVQLSENIQTIEESTFKNCSNLKSISVPSSVESIGKNAFENCTSLTAISYGKKVAEIGESAFSGCSQLTSVEIPELVKVIRKTSFSGCTKLEQVELPSGVETIEDSAFARCEVLQDIVLPDGVKEIGSSAFSGCVGLKEIQIPDGITTISQRCFQNCSGLTQIVIPKTITNIEGFAFEQCKNLKEIIFLGDAPTIETNSFKQVVAICYYPKGNTTYTAEITTNDFGGDLKWTYEGEEEDSESRKCGENITWTLSEDGMLTLSGSGAMYNYSKDELKYAPWYENRNSVTSLQIADGITHIGDYAFYGCGLTVIDSLPDSITTIGAYAFASCRKLKSINHMPDNLTTIGKYVFYYCSSLTSVENLPDSITEIGEYAFSECGLTRIKLPVNLGEITNGMLYDCKYLKQVVFPKKLKTIGEYAFSMCLGLNSVEIPEGVTSIGEGAFASCGNYASWGAYYPSSSFTSVKLPSTLQSLGNNVFRWCTSLQTINIPGKTVEVGNGAFSYCYNLSNVTFEWSAPKLASDIFDICKNTTITCYYPGNNPEWIADKLQKYGAYKVNWIAKEMTKPAEGGGSGGSGGGGTGTGSGESGSGSDSGSGTGSGSGGSGSGSGSDSGNSGSGSSSGGSSSGGGSESGGSSSGGSGTGGSGSGSGGNESGDSGNAGGSGSEITLGYTAHSLTLNGDIGVNFYLELNDAIIKDSSAVMQMEVNSQKVSEIKVADVVKNGTTEVTDEEGNTHACYKFTCNVYAKQMNDTIQATLKSSVGTWKETYSIKQYAEQAQNGSSENLKEAVNAMLDYGIWAQTLFGYRTDSLDGASLPDVSGVTKDQLSAYAYVKSGQEDNLAVYGASLLLKEKTTIRMYYNLKSGSIEDYTFKIDGKEVTPTKSGNKGLYYVEVNDIAVQDLDEAHTFTAGNLEVSNYSALSYVGNVIGKESSSENNRKTAAALYLYWNAAEKYFKG